MQRLVEMHEPGVDPVAPGCVVGPHRRLGEGVVEVHHDQRRLDVDAPVVHEGRHHVLGVALHVLGIVLLARHEVDLVGRELDALLRQHEAHLLGARGEAKVVELDHGFLSGSAAYLSHEQRICRSLQNTCQMNNLAP